MGRLPRPSRATERAPRRAATSTGSFYEAATSSCRRARAQRHGSSPAGQLRESGVGRKNAGARGCRNPSPNRWLGHTAQPTAAHRGARGREHPYFARGFYSPARAARTHRAGERRCPYDSNTTLTFSGAAPSARSAWLSLGGNPSTQRGCPLAWVYHQQADSLLASCAALARSSSEQRVLDAGTPPNRPPRVEE